MKLLLGFLAGAAWGVLGACLNNCLLGRALASGRAGKLLGTHVLRAAVDLALLAVIVLLRDLLPFPFEMALAGAVSAIGMMGIYFAFRTAAAPGTKSEETEKKNDGSN